MRFGLWMGACLALAGCSSPEEMGDAIAGERNVDATVASTRDPRPVDFEDNDARAGGTRDFAYSWPAAASAVPALAAILAERREAALAEQKGDWEQALVDFAGEDCVGCKARSHTTSWNVAADTARFFSLEGETSIYSGGAHPNSFFDALVWDRKQGDAIEPMDLFTSPAAFSDALREAYCEGLVDAQAERRGEVYPSYAGMIDRCPGFDQLVIVPVSSNGEAIDAIRVLAAPYVAGAYAEGPYVVTVPVTPELVAAVKEDYRAAFAAP